MCSVPFRVDPFSEKESYLLEQTPFQKGAKAFYTVLSSKSFMRLFVF